MTRAILTALLAITTLLAAPAHAQNNYTPRTWLTVKVDAKTTMRYALILPNGFDKEREYPVLLAMPPGAQDENMTEDALARYWEKEAKARGWAVVSPISTQEGADFKWEIDPLLDDVARHVKVEGGRFHLAGISNGGLSAFNLAIREPEKFASLTTLPGHPPTAADFAKLARIKDIPVTMFVGELDTRWHDEGQKTEDKLKKLGGRVKFEIVKGEGHVMNLKPKDLFDLFEAARPRATPAPAPETPEQAAAREAAGAALDDFHDAAAKADFDRYFARFTDDAVFVGTDPTERWTVEEFRKYCEPNFRIGKGWTYTPVDRHISFSARSDTAWFDELLENSKYGLCRGSGVLCKVTTTTKDADGKPRAQTTWKVQQYVLSFTVPNDTAEQVTRITKPRQKKPAAPADAEDTRKKPTGK
ncbi:MAG: nuclear transport factor 2 family protein [Phycisphaerales bacterium]